MGLKIRTDPALRALADYYACTGIEGTGGGTIRIWPSSIYSESVRSQLEAGAASNADLWDEWHHSFH